MREVRANTDTAVARAAFQIADPRLLPELAQRLGPGTLAALAALRAAVDAHQTPEHLHASLVDAARGYTYTCAQPLED
ncbi:hypothetical protein OG216_01070 [Streptomycetaceae bacterium NBC_01309]